MRLQIEDGELNVIDLTAAKKINNMLGMNLDCPFVLIILLAILLCPSLNNLNAREVGRINPISSHVSDSFKCDNIVEISVHAPDRSYFSKGNSKLQRLVSTTGMTLGFQCPKISILNVTGIVDESRVFEGYSKKDRRWLLVQGKLKNTKTVIQKEVAQTRNKRIIGFPTTIEGNAVQHNKKIGPFFVSLRIGNETPAGKPVLPQVSIPQKLLISLWDSTFLPCAGLMNLDIKVWPKAFNYDQFLKTRKGSDLPPTVIDALYLMRDLLSEQCDVKDLRFRFSALYPGEDCLQYIGTISSDSDWVIQDGIVQTSFDHLKKIRIVYKDQLSPVNPAGMCYKGTCEKNPILPLTQVYRKEPTKPWTGDLKIDLFHYKRAALQIAKMYADLCPNVETISFTMNPVPEEYVCKDKKQCYLIWNKQKPSEVISDYKYQEKPRLKNYNDVMNAFIDGNYKLLDEYKGYVRFFHNDFLEIYSDFCSNYMTQRVAIAITPFEIRYDSDGFVESRKQIGETYRIYIEPRYLDRFESFRGVNHVWALAKLTRIVSNKTSIQATNQAVWRALDVFIGDRNMIKNFINTNKCKGDKTQVLYENLDRYFRQMPPKSLSKQ